MDILYVGHLHQAEQLYSCGRVNTPRFSAHLCVGAVDCAPSIFTRAMLPRMCRTGVISFRLT